MVSQSKFSGIAIPSPRRLLFFCVVFAGCVSTVPAWAAAYVRVSQIGYPTGAARAYLLNSSAVSGVHFAVKNSGGSTVTSGTVGAKLGVWGTMSVYPIDFSVTAVGSYTIAVSGPVAATSPLFSIDTVANLYSPALANTLSYFQNGRDGANFIPSPLRTAAGHLNDTSATVYNTPSFNANDLVIGSLVPAGGTINAEGGWADAGDYLKFVQTVSYVEAVMLAGVRDFPNQMGGGSSSDYTSEARFGLDWLQKMWNDSTKTLYYQVGIGTDFVSFSYLSDHDLWRLPQDDDATGGTDPNYQYIRHRPVFVAGPAGASISPNLAGRLAADFALCYRVFKVTDAAYANQCLLSAEHIFDLANTAPTTLLTVAPFSFYPETEYRDDLELGATELYLAIRPGGLPGGLPHTDPNYYLTRAANWASSYIHGPNDKTDTLNLYDVSGLAHFDLYRAITLAGNPVLAVTQADLANDILGQMTTSISQAGDPFGSGYAWKQSDTTSHISGMSVMASEYFYLTGNTTYSVSAGLPTLLEPTPGDLLLSPA
jgi:endoglucanase